MNQTIQKHSTNNTEHSKYKYTYYQNTHTLQNKLKQPQYQLKQPQFKMYPNETVTMQSGTFNIRSP